MGYEDYVWIPETNRILRAENTTGIKQEVVYLGRFLSYEEAKDYKVTCYGK